MIQITVLVDHQIAAAVADGTIGISPYNPDNLQPNSYDIRLGTEYLSYLYSTEPLDTRNYGLTVPRASTCDIDKPLTLYPLQFMLGTTIEKLKLPDNICAEITGRSSYARLGIELHQTAGWIDAGFEGTITLEMVNNNCVPIILYPGDRIGQIVFHQTVPCELPYGTKKDSKYQGQIGVTASRIFDDQRNLT